MIVKRFAENKSTVFQGGLTVDRGKNLFFVSTNSTISPSITVSGGPTPIWLVLESTGNAFKYEAASFSHTKTAGTGNMTVRLVNTEAVKNYVTGIDCSNDGIISRIEELQLYKIINLNSINLITNAMTGNIIPITSRSIPTVNLGSNSFANDLTGWSPNTGITLLNIGATRSYGNLTGINLTNLNYLIMSTNNFTGVLSGTSLSNNITLCYLHANAFTDAPRINIAVSSLNNFRFENNGILQSAVDQIINDIYQNRANFTYATPVLNVGGTNAAPSGIYQNATPPTTGKEKIYKLVNDPDLEGFHKWTITYTA